MIASKNGIVAWKREGGHDDPVRVIAGGDFGRPGRLADLHLMHYLRACADAVSVGAQTLRDHPDLMETPTELGGLSEVLYRFRASHGLHRFPLQVVYSEHGRLELDAPVFNTPTLAVIVITTEAGARVLRSQGSDDRGITIVVAGNESIDSVGLVRSHERLFDEFGVHYVDCEGGAVVLDALHRAGILDEVFVTVTDVHVEASEHEGVKRMFAFGAGSACLIAEGRTALDSGYVFRRWRFNER
ncbi:MAG TPA: dihydrofolate reductase family protein [Methylomirabilota bacterium]|nr:dihydrofolate reductase family protein [Methylomirabilota bacterium]